MDRVGCVHTCVQPDSVETPTSVCTQVVQHRQLWAQSQGMAVHCMFILTTLDACDLCQLWHVCAVSMACERACNKALSSSTSALSA